ncbi:MULTISPECIES: BMP family ABC transporter substrate-binding protein [Bradyrhizobium]|uniref:BMP family ABC transporter substrate-binding protein n=1 Tax=Bradyrhizobium elkanii TaxID=29448 RepID=UPI000480A1BB|nr:BMP family ABC transporter substrate-binding protein [Bradyrhizobium elkanii]
MSDLRHLSRRRFLNLGAAAGSSLLLPPGLIRSAHAAAPLPAIAEKDAVIAFGHTGPVTDEGWTWSHDQGMKAVKAAFPQVKTVFVESIPYSADATRTYRQFVSENACMVFATSNYGDFLYDVAKRSPKVAFYECDGRNPLDNLSTYYVAHWYPTYVTGVAAGLMSKSGKLGYVASFPVPSVFSGTNAFLMGARSVNPNATMQVITINSWFDPQAATQAGTALLDNGCDLLFGIMDEAGYLQVAEKRGAKAVMWNTDIRRYGPKAYISSIVIDFKQYYVGEVKKRLEGTWTPSSTILPMGAGVDRDAWGESVPEDMRKQADAVREKILGGWSPFVGEIKDAKGNVKVASGKRMSETELYNWDWPIAGISGL